VIHPAGTAGVAEDPSERDGEAARCGGVRPCAGSVHLVADGARHAAVPGIPVGSYVGGVRLGRLVPGDRVRPGARVTGGGLAGGWRGPSVEQGRPRRTVAPLAER